MMDLKTLTVDTKSSAFAFKPDVPSLDEIRAKYPAAKLKSDELFFKWLSMPSNLEYVQSLIRDFKDGVLTKESLNAYTTSQASPGHVSSPGSSKGWRSPRQSPPLSPKHQSPLSPRSALSPQGKKMHFTEELSIENLGKQFQSVEISQTKTPQPKPIVRPTARNSPLKQHRTKLSTKQQKITTIERFYFPKQGGRGRGKPLFEDSLENKKQDIIKAFSDYSNNVNHDDFVTICKDICRFPVFFYALLFRRIKLLTKLWNQVGESKENEAKEMDHCGETKTNGEQKEKDDWTQNKVRSPCATLKSNKTHASKVRRERSITEEGRELEELTKLEECTISLDEFLQFWKREMEPYDHIDRFFRLLKRPQEEYIYPEDLLPMMDDLLSYHPGLEFLEQTPEFQEKYAKTVIARIMYKVNTSCSGAITAKEFRKSNFVHICHDVDEEEDINAVTEYFSYQHFYVLYCKFWLLDTDRDFLLSQEDLMKHAGHSLTNRIIKRIFQQAPRPFVSGVPGKMGYEDFIYFFLSEEDKSNEISLKYWFKCIDIDGDGVIEPWEMKHFFTEQLNRLRCLGHEEVSFENVLCQLHDCIVPETEGKFVFKDFMHPERKHASGVFFNVLFNLNKFLEFEQKNPFASRQMQADMSDWDRYAAFEYAHLAGEQQEDEECMTDEDDYDISDEGKLSEWNDLEKVTMSAESPF